MYFEVVLLDEQIDSEHTLLHTYKKQVLFFSEHLYNSMGISKFRFFIVHNKF